MLDPSRPDNKGTTNGDPRKLEHYQRCLDLSIEYSSYAEAARSVGIPQTTFKYAVQKARALGLVPGGTPDAPPSPAGVSEILEGMPSYSEAMKRVVEHNPQHIREFYDERSLTVRVPHRIFCKAFIGDLHMDSPGFDVDWYNRDMELIRRAQGELPTISVFMGDVLDNWPISGRLSKKNRQTAVTRKEGLALLRGFLQEEGLDLSVFLMGNHDQWLHEEFEVLVRQWTSAKVADWACTIRAVTEKGWGFSTFASHDMRGSSIHNPVHGLARRAREDGAADLYVAAHRHMGGQGKDQNGFRDRTYNYLRVRGFKRADEFAWSKGYPEENEGACGLAVINPFARMQDNVCRTFYDLEEGLDWAKFLRKKYE